MGKKENIKEQKKIKGKKVKGKKVKTDEAIEDYIEEQNEKLEPYDLMILTKKELEAKKKAKEKKRRKKPKKKVERKPVKKEEKKPIKEEEKKPIEDKSKKKRIDIRQIKGRTKKIGMKFKDKVKKAVEQHLKKKKIIEEEKIDKEKISKYGGPAVKKLNPTEIKRCAKIISDMKKEIAKVVIGQEDIVDSLIRAILCDGHVLLEGVPGIAKTLAIKALATVSGCDSKRIQFTVDLLPTDILGLTTYTPQKGFEIIKGPIFANFIIADEVNRSPPKTQSALIEAMQEKQVTIGKTTFQLPMPFFVMANENPLETSGVYTLPEAQIDRFLFKLLMGYPNIDDEHIIMERNMTLKKFEDFGLKAVTSAEEIIKMQKLTKEIYLSDKIKTYILKIVELTRTKDFEHGRYIEWGASPRASIALFIASKARALMQGRNFVIPKDVKDVIYGTLRHRIILSYRARVENIDSDKIISEILSLIRVP